MSAEQIAAEVSRQLSELKAQIFQELDERIERYLHKCDLQKCDLQKTQKTEDLAIVDADKRAIAIGEQVYTQIITEINRDVVPKVNQLMQWVNYNMQDGGEIVTDYRRAVEHQTNDGTMLLTDHAEAGDDRLIAPNIRLFFSESRD